LVGKAFALVKAAVGHMENPFMFVFYTSHPPAMIPGGYSSLERAPLKGFILSEFI
jgi:hypothetical protein